MSVSADVESRLRDIRTRRAQLEQQRARAQVARDQAEATKRAALEELQRLGFATPEEAQKRLEELQVEISQALDAAEQTIERIPL